MKNVVSFIALYISKAGIEVTVGDKKNTLELNLSPISSEVKEFISYLVTSPSELFWNFVTPKGHHTPGKDLRTLTEELNSVSPLTTQGFEIKLLEYFELFFPINDISFREALRRKAKTWIEGRLSRHQTTLTTPSGPSEAH